MKHGILRSLMTFALGTGVYTSAYADSNVLTAAVAERDYPPYYYTEPATGQLTGISTEICERLATRLGYRLEHQRFPFVRILNNLDEGTTDIACTLFNTRQRAPGIIFTSVPHVFEDLYVIARKDELKQVPEHTDGIAPFAFGGVRGYYYGERYIPNLTLFNSDDHLGPALVNRRVDLVISNVPTFRWYAEANGIAADAYEVVEPVWFTGAIYMGFSRSRPDAQKLAAEFTEALVEFRRTSEYRTLLAKYGLTDVHF
ncbi:MAG: transporter substrate-binding domain-containing protein [Thalassolituus sp.]